MSQPCPAQPPCADYAPERSIGLQLRRIVNQLGAAIECRVEPLGLTDAQWKPLVRLLGHEHVSASALARECHMDSGGLTRLLDRLEAKGLVQRERAPHDRRVVQVALTPPAAPWPPSCPRCWAACRSCCSTAWTPPSRTPCAPTWTGWKPTSRPWPPRRPALPRTDSPYWGQIPINQIGVRFR